jgi:hypothetical protein
VSRRSRATLVSCLVVIWGVAITAVADERLEPISDSDSSIERISWVGHVGMDRTIRVENPFGDVRLRFGGWKGDLEIAGVLQQLASSSARIDVEIADTEHTLVVRSVTTNKVGDPIDRPAGDRSRVDLAVLVPAGSAIEVDTEGGLIEVEGLRSGVHAETISGRVIVNELHGGFSARTDSGDVLVTLLPNATESDQRIVTSTGDVTVFCPSTSSFAFTMATSGTLTTDFSLAIEHLDGQEPDKLATGVIGTGGRRLELASKRGALALRRVALPASATARDDE